MIKAIIFDYGGVLGSGAGENFKNVLANHGLNPELSDVLWNSHWPNIRNGVYGIHTLWEQIAHQTGIDAMTLMREYDAGISVDEELIAYIRGLKRSYGVSLAILANESREGMALKKKRLQELNALDLFDVIRCSAEMGVPKPHPQSFTTVLEELNASPSETIFVDNLFPNTSAAKTLGMEVILCRSTQQLKEDLDRLLCHEPYG